MSARPLAGAAQLKRAAFGGDRRLMSRVRAVVYATVVAVADAFAILFLTGYAQALADTAGHPSVPWWLEPAWLITFFPMRYVYSLPQLNHPLGLGGPNDFVVLGGLTMLNGLLWGAAVYAALRRRRRSVA